MHTSTRQNTLIVAFQSTGGPRVRMMECCTGVDFECLIDFYMPKNLVNSPESVVQAGFLLPVTAAPSMLSTCTYVPLPFEPIFPRFFLVSRHISLLAAIWSAMRRDPAGYL